LSGFRKGRPLPRKIKRTPVYEETEMRILLIGATGFIGSYVTPELQSLGHHVCVFHRGKTSVTNAEEIIGDRKCLADKTTDFRRFAPDVVVDMVLSSRGQAELFMNVFRGLARRAVVLSSMDVYMAAGILHGTEPGPPQELPLTETSEVRRNRQVYPAASVKALQNVFDWLDDEYDKVSVEETVQNDAALPTTVLRLPMVFGPGDRLHRIFPILKRIADGRRHFLFASDAAAWRGSRGYVQNVAHAIVLAATSDQAAGRVYNIAEPTTFTELEWARLVAKAAEWPGNFVTLPPEKIPAHLRTPGNLAQHWVASSQRIREELGYEELISLDEGLRRTIAWERQNPPSQVDSRQFDYDAEDKALAESS
jgi:nucleoside-diphosphate-sugar epimerase